ncbi:YafY family protein [uncultured Sphaerochaeta sp.]|uniref:helix-turn-helix transcriptional regulator n=1 Tax=uncultured Sphaerochaeta sp. TaxID=886478 RepID=UPI002A0A33FE|nr:YafY family protein [uncultured Sphaerochaeta sp.]
MKIDRLVSIIMVLLEKERIGAQALSEMFEVSLRTIYRDIETINLSGIPIRSTPGWGGGFEILSEYKVDRTVFSSSDLATILMGLGSISTMLTGEEIVNTLAKVKSIIPTEQAKEIELKSSQISIDLSPWRGNANIHTYLGLIKTALQKQRLLSFNYSDRYNNISTRTIEPYQLVLKDNHWYIHGYCLEKQDFRLFKLSRISNLEMLTDRFIQKDFNKQLSEFSDTMTQKQKNIKLRIHKSIMDRVLEYCSYDHFSQDSNEHYIVEFPFIDDEFGYNIVFGFGDKCECLAPENIRAGIKQRVQNMSDIYANEF